MATNASECRTSSCIQGHWRIGHQAYQDKNAERNMPDLISKIIFWCGLGSNARVDMPGTWCTFKLYGASHHFFFVFFARNFHWSLCLVCQPGGRTPKNKQWGRLQFLVSFEPWEMSSYASAKIFLIMSTGNVDIFTEDVHVPTTSSTSWANGFY